MLLHKQKDDLLNDNDLDNQQKRESKRTKN